MKTRTISLIDTRMCDYVRSLIFTHMEEMNEAPTAEQEEAATAAEWEDYSTMKQDLLLFAEELGDEVNNDDDSDE